MMKMIIFYVMLKEWSLTKITRGMDSLGFEKKQ